MSYVSPMLSSVYSYSTSASLFFLFFFNDTATTEIYTLSLHDALPICGKASASRKSESPAGDPGGNIAKARCTSRSEEHTSELQSHSDLVCRLLLEKKKKKQKTYTKHNTTKR